MICNETGDVLDFNSNVSSQNEKTSNHQNVETIQVYKILIAP